MIFKKEHKFILSKQIRANKTSSRFLFELGDVKVEILEEGLFETKHDLFRVEGKYQRIMNCVNKQIADRSQIELTN